MMRAATQWIMERKVVLQAIVVLTACFVVALIAGRDVSAQQLLTKVDGEKHAGELIVALNRSIVLRLDTPFKNLLIGNSEIADVVALTDRSVYVLGKEIGTTSLTVYGPEKGLIAVAGLVITHDIQGLKRRLHDLMPDERIEVRPANGSLILSGSVSSSNRLGRAVAIAEQFAPGGVVNLLSVKGSQQVMLSVRFAEVTRELAKELGVNAGLQGANAFHGGDVAVTTGDALLSGTFSASAFITGALTGVMFGKYTLDVLFDALEQKGLVKTLAEPNLIALSGDTASFLAGGEFPVPVARDTDAGGITITVEFKEFGVSLSFTPTVLDDGLINMLVAPEVSKIDPTNSVTLTGFEIPGLTTRRAQTTVELRDGQSFAIAGLIQSDFQDTVRQVPGVADIPILGALLRSTAFQRNETELVIIVTPHLVQPAQAGTLRAPTDNFVPPSDFDAFVMGQVESPHSGVQQHPAVRPLELEGAGGIEGRYGHIIR